jgi:hypothetical protein
MRPVLLITLATALGGVFAGCDGRVGSVRQALEALAVPVISPELQSDTPINGFNPFSAQFPSVARGNGQYLVTWLETRDPMSRQVFAARVALDGTLLDQAPIVISDERIEARSADVAFDGTNFLVVWSHATLQQFYGDLLMAVRVSAAGVVLDERSIRFGENLPRDLLRPSVTFNGSNYLVAWTASDESTGIIQAARVSTSGQFLDATPISLSSTAPFDGKVDVATFGTTSVVVWVDTRQNNDGDIYTARISEAGTVLNPSALAVTNAAGIQREPAIACGSSQCLVAWADGAATSTSARPFAARLDGAGAVLDPNGFVLANSSSGAPSPSFDGTNYLVAFSAVRDGFDAVVNARVTQGGAVLDSTPLLVQPPVAHQREPAAAFGSTDSLIVWADSRAPGGPTIHCRRLAPGGEPLGARLAVSNSTETFVGDNVQLRPSAAFDGTQLFVVWEDWSRGIVGTRVDLSGAARDPQGIVVANRSAGDPHVAFGGNHFQVIWRGSAEGQSSRTLARRITSDGGLLDGAGINLLPTSPTYTRVLGAAGSEFLAVWVETGPSGNGNDLRGMLIGLDGQPRAATSLPIIVARNNQVNPSVSFDGSKFLVVWSDFDDAGVRGLSARTVAESTGSLGGIVRVGRSSQPGYFPASAFGGGQTLIVWEQENGLQATFLVPDGGQTPPRAMSSASVPQRWPTVAFDGTSFLAAWEQADDIVGMQVFMDGGTSASPFPIVRGPAIETAPTLVAVAEGRYYVAYNSTNLESANRAPRVKGRFITFEPRELSEPCASTAECATGVCEGGVCSVPTTTTPAPRVLAVGCGCSDAAGAPWHWGLLSLVPAGWPRRARRGRRGAERSGPQDLGCGAPRGGSHGSTRFDFAMREQSCVAMILVGVVGSTGCFLYPQLEDLRCQVPAKDDARNCGRCGHDCLGGVCVEGRCAPFVVADSQSYPVSIDVDSERVWWVNSGSSTACLDGDCYVDGAVVSARKSDGARREVGSRLLKTGNRAVWIRAAGEHVYWANYSYARRVWRANAETGEVQVVSPYEPMNVKQLAVDALAGEVFWTEGRGQPDGGQAGMVRAIPTTGGDPRDVLRQFAEVAALALDGSGLYISLTSRGGGLPNIIQRLPREGCADGGWCGEVLATQDGRTAQLLVTDDATIYWADSYRGHVAAVAKSEPRAQEIIATVQVDGGLPLVRGLALDAEWIYWTEQSNGTVLRRRKNSPDGPEVLAVGQRHPGAIAVDARAIYWVNQGTPAGLEAFELADGQIVRLAKPE